MYQKPPVGRSSQVSPQFFFIELVTYWQGRIKVSDLERQFGVSRQSGSKQLKAYEVFYLSKTGKDAFTKSDKTHRRELASDFSPLFINKHVDQYLTWLVSGGLDLATQNQGFTNANQLPLPTRNIEPVIIRALVQAIKETKRLEVEYVSLSRPVNDGRIIIPHSFVKTNLRWHVRAWDEENKRFADFNLSRFRGTPDTIVQEYGAIPQDTAWHTVITLVLKPDSRLSPEKQKILEQDYEMHDGELRIETRACLATYLLQELRVSAKFVDVSPEAQQLVLVNRDEVKEWLFDV